MSEANETFHGLSIDLTNCLAQRNAELKSARKVIAGLIVATVLAEGGDKTITYQPIVNGRKWLKEYNDRVYPKREAVHDL